MGLRLSYVDRSRLWADLVNTDGERVFIQTEEPYVVGAHVALLVWAPEFSAPLQLSAVVQSLRPANGPLTAGVVVKLDPGSVERCRSAIGAVKEDPVRIAGRKESRVDCNLEARVTSPRPIDKCVAKSLSASGFTLTGAGFSLEEPRVTVQLMLPDGKPVEINSQVLWVRPELGLAGFRIISLSPDAANRINEAVGAIGSTKKVASTGITILVADDDPSILDFAFRAISKAGHRVLRAERGDTALTLVREERPKLVFLDVLMPGLDGLEVCKAIRRDDALGRTPVVLLSAMGEARLADAVQLAGANDYLTKPMRLEALRALVQKYVG
jgi:CheY-like chemotaxis protein/Tfp pilus assembly protein PilZ